MPGQGPAPKAAEQRRRYNQPARSEWIELPATLEKPVLPTYQGHYTVPRRYYGRWRSDPLTTQYNDADLAAMDYLATEWVALPYPERRQMMDRLGLNPKARRDLRWRTQLEAEQQREAVAKVRKLRIVAKEEA